MGRRRFGWDFHSLGLGCNQLAKCAQGRKVFRDEFLVLDPNAAIGFQECNQANNSKRVNLQRLVLIFYRGQGKTVVIDVVFNFLWYLHDFGVVVC